MPTLTNQGFYETTYFRFFISCQIYASFLPSIVSVQVIDINDAINKAGW